MSSLPSPPRAQSANAIPGGTSKKDSCTRCGQPVAQYYFRVNGAMHCMPCAKEMKNALPEDASAAYRRALRFGAIAALVAFILYSVYGIVTGWEPGYASFVAGYAIAKLMMAGSHKIGGRRYQLTAILLTYMAVSLSAVPIALAEQARWRAAVRAQQHTVDLAEEQRRLEQEFGTNASAPVPSSPKQRSARKNSAGQNETAAITTWQGQGRAGVRPSSQISPAAMLGSLVVLGLFSPILELLRTMQGGICLLVLLAGMVIAWQITAATRHEIIGPFRT
jgi:DNA-binding protein H-NS